MSNDEMTREIYLRVVGDGTESNPGLDKRVDRLEFKQRILTWAIGVSAATGITWVVNLLLTKLQGKP